MIMTDLEFIPFHPQLSPLGPPQQMHALVPPSAQRLQPRPLRVGIFMLENQPWIAMDAKGLNMFQPVGIIMENK